MFVMMLDEFPDPPVAAAIERTAATRPELWEGLTDDPTNDTPDEAIPEALDEYFSRR